MCGGSGSVQIILPVPDPTSIFFKSFFYWVFHILLLQLTCWISQCVTVILLENMVWIFGAWEYCIPPPLEGSNLLTLKVEGWLWLLSQHAPIEVQSADIQQGWASVLFKRMQRSCVLFRSLQKNAAFFAIFSVLYKRTPRSLHSFPFFIKERKIFYVLFRSL